MADEANKQLLSLLTTLTEKVDRLEKNSTESKKTGKAGYRLICSKCIQCVDIPQEAIQQSHNVGAGRDIDGSYDSGYSCYSLECPKCRHMNTRRGVLREHLGQWIFKVTM